MAGFATADAILIATNPLQTTTVDQPPTPQPDTTGSGNIIGKQVNPDVVQVAQANNFVVTDATQPAFLPEIITDEPVQQKTLLFENDRAASISWVESPRVKVYYLALKEALHQNFSPLVTDLADETKTTPTGVTYNQLTFVDTGISEDRITFVRIRDRLYEIRTVIGNEANINNVITSLLE